jgi:N-methylhydantoinase A
MVVGVDIGGTFTDFVVLDRDSGEFEVGKVLTTPDDPSRAVLDGLSRLVDADDLRAGEVDAIIHGTTLATNAIVQRTGARTALVTTRGFRDVLEIRREKRFDIHDLSIDMPAPLVPRSLRFEVEERISSSGEVLADLEEQAVLELSKLLASEAIESIAVVLLNSFVNDEHERRLAELLARQLDGVFVSLSSTVNPEIREYERTSTTVVNAYIQPLIKRYLESLEQQLAELGYDRPLYLMLSDGGVTSAQVAAREPVRIIESGPAGGAVAASFIGGVAECPDLIAFDMGGTTAKICLIEAGEPTRSSESEVGRLQWFQRGSGFPLRAPGLEMIEIGTGGGSIASLGDAGLVRVGPRSAGADPGPACYSRSGTNPTVTDADLLLGYLDGNHFLGGAMKLDDAAAERAIDEHIAQPQGISILEAAWAVHEIANEQMAISARLHIIQRGCDPADYVMCAFGGAGPVHAARVAERLGVRRILYPQGAGVASAFGFLAAPLSIGVTGAYASLLREVDAPRLNRVFSDMETEAASLLSQSGAARDQVTFRRYAALCYDGQGYEVETLLPDGFPANGGLEALEETFHTRYAQLYGRADRSFQIKALTWRLVATGPRPTLKLKEATASGNVDAVPRTHRPAYFPESDGFVDCPVYDRQDLFEGTTIEGPAVIEEAESTVILTPRMRATALRANLLMAVINADGDASARKEN